MEPRNHRDRDGESKANPEPRPHGRSSDVGRGRISISEGLPVPDCGDGMNYKDSVLYITHLHEIARQFETEKEALEIAGELNVGRPEGLRAFRIESCGECKRF